MKEQSFKFLIMQRQHLPCFNLNLRSYGQLFVLVLLFKQILIHNNDLQTDLLSKVWRKFAYFAFLVTSQIIDQNMSLVKLYSPIAIA